MENKRKPTVLAFILNELPGLCELSCQNLSTLLCVLTTCALLNQSCQVCLRTHGWWDINILTIIIIISIIIFAIFVWMMMTGHDHRCTCGRGKSDALSRQTDDEDDDGDYYDDGDEQTDDGEDGSRGIHIKSLFEENILIKTPKIFKKKIPPLSLF